MSVTQLVPVNEMERRAAALADVHQMHEDLKRALDMIAQLKADLHRQRDRVAMMTEERNRYRADALDFRSKLIELATVQTNIGLLSITAQEIMRAVHEITNRETEIVLTDDNEAA